MKPSNLTIRTDACDVAAGTLTKLGTRRMPARRLKRNFASPAKRSPCLAKLAAWYVTPGAAACGKQRLRLITWIDRQVPLVGRNPGATRPAPSTP